MSREVTVRCGRGPLATEGLLFAELAARLAAIGPLPKRPLRIVVPSQSLRSHLLARLAHHADRPAWLGVVCQTHYELALDVLRRRGRPLRSSPTAFRLVVRRLARRERDLAEPLGRLEDGLGQVVGTIEDLLDAGFGPDLAAPVEEALAGEGPAVATAQERRRAAALLRVAAAVSGELAARVLARPADLLVAAAEDLLDDRSGGPPTAAVLVHGFAEVTAIVGDLLTAFLGTWGGVLLLDHPPDPAAPRREDPGARFTRRLRERLGFSAVPPAAPVPTLVTIDALQAAGARAECREVARRIRVALDAGARPEGIGVVARATAPYRRPLATELERLGIPYSGWGVEGQRNVSGRRLDALLDLLARGPDASTERWLEAAGDCAGSAPVFEIRVALHALGAGRLRDVAALAPELETQLVDGDLPLPIRHGGGSIEPAGDDGEAAAEEEIRGDRTRRRRVAGATLRSLVADAGGLVARLDGWPAGRPIGDHLRHLAHLVDEDLRWAADEEPAQLLTAASEEIAWSLPSDEALAREDLLLALRDALADAGRERWGGRGGGVQVLDALGARGRTFERLFLLGLQRGTFPRTPRSDPLLGDPLREVLARQGTGVLPDLPVKLAAGTEERYLFGQLLAAAPAVTLSWQLTDDRGREQSPSPFVVRLLAAGTLDAASSAPPIHPPLAALAEDDLLPAAEAVIAVGLTGDRGSLRDLLPIAIAEARRATGSRGGPQAVPVERRPAADRVARARLAVLDELDPPIGSLAARPRLGPYFGFVGALGETADPGDPRSGPLFVTSVEGLARCPWQTFLHRVLHLAPLPDPLEALPGIGPRLVGSVVHATLAAIAPGGAESLESAEKASPRAPGWPSDDELAAMAEAAARAVCRDEGIRAAGLAAVLGRAARSALLAARTADWTPAPPPSVGTEIRGSSRVTSASGRPWRLHFRADRADRVATGLLLTDYKTGRPPSPSADPEQLRRSLLTATARGLALQASCYAASEVAADGRYLYLPSSGGDAGPGIALMAARDDAELDAAFRRAVGDLLALWEQGALFPRLVDPATGHRARPCRTCDVVAACLQGDAGARRRLYGWADEHAAAGNEPWEEALLAVYRLPRHKGATGDSSDR